LWKISGTKGKKIAEIENLEIIANMMSLKPQNTGLKQKIDSILGQLSRMV